MNTYYNTNTINTHMIITNMKTDRIEVGFGHWTTDMRIMRSMTPVIELIEGLHSRVG